MILDYLRKSTNAEIIIPNFHTGHLGFVPGTEVSVSLHELFTHNNKRQCELLVTPFDPNFSTLFYLSCTMKDQPGVVNKLLEAISSMEINIVKKESSSINSLNHHVVELVLDWKTSQYKTNNESTPTEITRNFNSISHLLPLKLNKYFLLYKSIMARCCDVINFNNVYGEYLPSLKIIPFTENIDPFDVRKVLIQRKEGKKSVNAFITIDPKHLSRIRTMCDSKNGEPLNYIINSEANTRSLRILILNSKSVDKVFHISFAHSDEPKALFSITTALEEANFNILTGLLRKKDSSESRYETLLEYQGADPILINPSTREERVNWVYNKIISLTDSTLNRLFSFDVEVSLPLYPNPHVDIVESKKIVPATLSEIPYTKIPFDTDEAIPEGVLIDKMLVDLKGIPDKNFFYLKERISILESLKKTINRKPVIFLSYPYYATEHAKVIESEIHKAFPDKYNVTQNQDSGFENILNKVKHEINDCDFFIGIWHHEFIQAKDEYGISPWMTFEYGVATTSDKKIIIARSDKLSEQIWKRIDPGIAKPSYNDLNFKDILLPKLILHLKENW